MKNKKWWEKFRFWESRKRNTETSYLFKRKTFLNLVLRFVFSAAFALFNREDNKNSNTKIIDNKQNKLL